MEDLDSRLLNSDEEGGIARELRERKRGGNNLAGGQEWRQRLNQARERAKLDGFEKSAIGKHLAKSATKKVAQGSNKIFIVLLLISLIIDLAEYLDLGTFSALISIGIYAITMGTGFILWFYRNNNNKFSIFNLLKGQLWKYCVIPLFEMIPIIELLPFWTGTVIMMWVKVNFERGKLTGKNKDEDKKSPAKAVTESKLA